jgi:hypothetical protein
MSVIPYTGYVKKPVIQEDNKQLGREIHTVVFSLPCIDVLKI